MPRAPAVLEAVLSLLINEADRQPARTSASWCSLDSTTRRTHKALCFRANNSAIKLHLLFDPDSRPRPGFKSPRRGSMTAGCARLGAHRRRYLCLCRAYNKAEFWAISVLRPSSSRGQSRLAYDVHQPKLYPNSLIVADEIITLAGRGRKYKKPLRRIEIFDEDKGREIAFITNASGRRGRDRAGRSNLLQMDQAEPRKRKTDPPPSWFAGSHRGHRQHASTPSYLFNLGDNQLIKPPDRHPPPFRLPGQYQWSLILTHFTGSWVPLARRGLRPSS